MGPAERMPTQNPKQMTPTYPQGRHFIPGTLRTGVHNLTLGLYHLHFHDAFTSRTITLEKGPTATPVATQHMQCLSSIRYTSSTSTEKHHLSHRKGVTGVQGLEPKLWADLGKLQKPL